MGLDMYLYGKEGRDEIELGYWRKHPNLHGFIIETFAEGLDNCQRIDLSEEDLHIIYDAVNVEALPQTDGFFFGESYPEDRAPSLQVFEKAIQWLKQNKKRTVFYRASW